MKCKKICFAVILLVALIAMTGCTQDTPTGEAAKFRPMQPLNDPPVVEAGGPYNTYINQVVYLTGIATDSDGTIKDLYWTPLASDCNILHEDINGLNTSYATNTGLFVCRSTGTKTVRLTAKDNLNAASSDTAIVTVSEYNQYPLASIIGAPYDGNVNIFISIYGEGTDSDGTISSIFWDTNSVDCNIFNEDINGIGTPYATNNAEIKCSSTGTKTITLAVIDNEGALDTDTETVEIH
ncbi:MAG: hypothetical protein ABIE23_01690 [archaeon]